MKLKAAYLIILGLIMIILGSFYYWEGTLMGSNPLNMITGFALIILGIVAIAIGFLHKKNKPGLEKVE